MIVNCIMKLLKWAKGHTLSTVLNVVAELVFAE